MMNPILPRTPAHVVAMLAVAAALLTAAGPAAADVLVLSSTAPAYKRGDRLGDGAMLDVPAGQRVDILRPGGQTQGITGPRTVKVGDLTRGEAVNEAIWKRVLDDLKDDVKGRTPGSIGAVRGVSR